MNKFESSDFDKFNNTNQANQPEINDSGLEKVGGGGVDHENNEEVGSMDENQESDLDGENNEENIEKTPEENFVDMEENLEAVNNALLGELQQEEKRQLEQDKSILEEQLQQQVDSLVEKEKTAIKEEIKGAIYEELMEELLQLEKKGGLEELAQDLSSEKPVEINTEGPLKEIAQKEPKTASEIIDKYLKGSSQNVLESIKFGYDVTTKLLEKIFKEKEDQENEGDLPSISDPEDGSSEEKEEKKDVFEELAEKRVSEQIEREREIRREQREKEKVKSENTSNIEEDVSPQTGVRGV